MHEVLSVVIAGTFGTDHLVKGVEVQILEGTNNEGQPNWVPLGEVDY